MKTTAAVRENGIEVTARLWKTNQTIVRRFESKERYDRWRKVNYSSVSIDKIREFEA